MHSTLQSVASMYYSVYTLIGVLKKVSILRLFMLVFIFFLRLCVGVMLLVFDVLLLGVSVLILKDWTRRVGTISLFIFCSSVGTRVKSEQSSSSQF